jgi:8-oxo-dGTP pyrophosphatase MutT (NUDIX family)
MKTHYKGKFLSLCETDDGFEYLHEHRLNNRELVACLLVSGHNTEIFGIRSEVCPPHQVGHHDASLTGGVDPGNTIIDTVCKEVKEESGYTITKDELLSLGMVYQGKMTDTRVHLYLADCTGKDQDELNLDDSFEKTSTFRWGSFKEAVATPDPIIHSLILRYIITRDYIDP